jgi:hypothetical protein
VERGEKAAAEIRALTGGDVVVEQMDLGQILITYLKRISVGYRTGTAVGYRYILQNFSVPVPVPLVELLLYSFYKYWYEIDACVPERPFIL